MSSRACCLEMTNGETTNDTLMALQRFGSRYRLPSHIYSDNAAAFVALQEFLSHWTGEQGNRPVNPCWLNVKWSFSHARAPHTNGVTESLIKSAKRAINHVLHKQTVTDDVLRTVFMYAEDILNCRPIKVVNHHPADPTTLTPAMLLGRAQGPLCEAPSGGGRLLEKWRETNRMAKLFWLQFQREVIPELEKANKWWHTVPGPKEGDAFVVLELEPKEGTDWPIGVVQRVYTDKEGLVRKVLVKVRGKTYERNLRHVMPLV